MIRETNEMAFMNFVLVPNIGNFMVKLTNYIMAKNTSISLGDYYDSFIENRLKEGRFKNASEVIRAGLRLLEEDENRSAMLRAEIEKGIESGINEDFDPEDFKSKIKKEHGIDGPV